MKKLLLVSGILSLLMVTGAEAITIGNPIETIGYGKFVAGADVGFVSRNIKDKIFVGNRSDLNDINIMGKAIYGFSDMFDIYIKLGVSDHDIDASTGNVLDADYRFAWGLGLKGKLYEFATGLKLGTDAQYYAHSSHQYSNVVSSRFQGDVDEWTVGLHVYQNFDIFTPYAGIRYSDYIVNVTGTGPINDQEATDNFGVYLGTDIIFTPNWRGSLEGRLVDETSFSAGFSYWF